MEAVGGFAGMFIAFVVGVVIFLVCRSLLLWYWKVNEIVDLLKSIDLKLGRLNLPGNNDPVPTTSPKTSSKVNPKTAFKNFEPLKDE